MNWPNIISESLIFIIIREDFITLTVNLCIYNIYFRDRLYYYLLFMFQRNIPEFFFQNLKPYLD